MVKTRCDTLWFLKAETGSRASNGRFRWRLSVFLASRTGLEAVTVCDRFEAQNQVTLWWS